MIFFFLSAFDLALGFDLVANGSITHLDQLPGFFKAQNIKQNPASRNKYTINIINGDKTAPAHSLQFEVATAYMKHCRYSAQIVLIDLWHSWAKEHFLCKMLKWELKGGLMGLGSVFVWILFAITLAERVRRGRAIGGRRGQGRTGVIHGHSEPTACEPGQGWQRGWAEQGGTGGSPWQLCPSGIGSGSEQGAALCLQGVPSVCPLQEEGQWSIPGWILHARAWQFWEAGLAPCWPGVQWLQKALNSFCHAELWVFQLHFVWKSVILSPGSPSGLTVSPAPAQRCECSLRGSCTSLLLTQCCTSLGAALCAPVCINQVLSWCCFTGADSPACSAGESQAGLQLWRASKAPRVVFRLGQRCWARIFLSWHGDVHFIHKGS